MHILQARLRTIPLKTRMPFKYGIATMTTFPLAFIELQCQINSNKTRGWSSDILPPKWFTKEAEKDPMVEIIEMQEVIEHACLASKELQADQPFDFWCKLYTCQATWAAERNIPSLLAQFGTSLIERAIMDAYCRFQGKPFHQLMLHHGLGFDPHWFGKPFALASMDETIPAKPLKHLIVRHTVGLSDPILDSDIQLSERLEDGLPQSLERCVAHYGIKHLKIKIAGNMQEDAERLLRIERMLETKPHEDTRFSLDGNERFNSMALFKDYWQRLESDPRLKRFFERILFVEQPLHRQSALEGETAATLSSWDHPPPIIIDESDGDIHSNEKGLSLGYAGTSHKNCKGIFKSIANACLLKAKEKEFPNRPFLISGEDLCNQGPISVIQDCCVAASLGISSVERNGHHYCTGLANHPTGIQKAIMQNHDDFYRLHDHGWPTLHIRDGLISTQSLNRSPFGLDFEPDLDDYPCEVDRTF